MEPLESETLVEVRARVARHVPRTPARRWPLLEQVTGTATWVKHENHNPTGAFKVRGGVNFLARLSEEEPQVPGLITATRGNHGQSLAFAGAAAGMPVVIVVPEGNSPDKNASMIAMGAELIVRGHDFQESREYADKLAAERGLVGVPPFHQWLIEGVATYAAELHEDVPDLDAIYVPIGMGSGICANIMVRDLLNKSTEIIGVVSELAPAYALSFEAEHPISTGTADTFVDGVACRTPDPEAVEIVNAGAARVVRVTEAEAEEAMRLMFCATHNLAEPAGSLSLAGLLADRRATPAAGAKRNVAIIHTGANADFDVLQRALKGSAS